MPGLADSSQGAVSDAEEHLSRAFVSCEGLGEPDAIVSAAQPLLHAEAEGVLSAPLEAFHPDSLYPCMLRYLQSACCWLRDKIRGGDVAWKIQNELPNSTSATHMDWQDFPRSMLLQVCEGDRSSPSKLLQTQTGQTCQPACCCSCP